jgi:hypothetical protein
MDAQGYISAEEVRQALRQIYLAMPSPICKTLFVNPFPMNSDLSMRRGAGNPARCSFSRSFSSALWPASLSTSPSEDGMSPYYDQPDRAREDRRMSPASLCYSPAPPLDSAGTSPCRASICAMTSASKSSSTAPSCSLAAASSLRTDWPQEEERGKLASPRHRDSGIKDAEMVRDANQSGATLLGYNVHKEPWLWPDTVRMKHGVIVGGTGAGKSTFLENIIAQDLTRRLARAGCR